MQMRCLSLSFLILVALSYNTGATIYSEVPTTDTNTLSQQRSIYVEAKQAFASGDLNRYQKLTQQITDYPLYSYLVALDLKARLDELPYYEVDQFILENSGSVIANRLLTEWLNRLAKNNHWHEYRSYFTADIRSIHLQCLNLWARIQTSDKSAFKEVDVLWNVDKSQPASCDPLFNEWIKQGYLSQSTLWSRYKKVIVTQDDALARYLSSLATSQNSIYFSTLKTIHRKPEAITNSKVIEHNNSFTKDIIEHALLQLQRKDSNLAMHKFLFLEKKHEFSHRFKELFREKYNTRKIYQYTLEELLQNDKLKSFLYDKEELIERLLLKAVREQNWIFYIEAYQKLSYSQKNKDQWLYWLAKALEEKTEQKQQSLLVLQKLSKQRGYYGFLAADRLQLPYTLEDKPLLVDEPLLIEVNHIPAIARARELFLTNAIDAARREWHDGTQSLSPAATKASAKIAHRWGWHRKAIEMLGSIKAWDHLAIRFPIVHQQFIEQKARQFNYSASLIYAITRQESAWQSDATSHAGARGLMQLIPSTAKRVAKKVGVKHKNAKLYIPQHNILLGSFHMSELLEIYDNNRLPAIAAYNAGQYRVNQWMKKSNKTLAFDIWIESIPFAETRKYVKNVLYYSALYDYRAGNRVQLLSQQERESFL